MLEGNVLPGSLNFWIKCLHVNKGLQQLDDDDKRFDDA